MKHQFSYPKVVELRPSWHVASQKREPRWNGQRELVQASLLRRPSPRHSEAARQAVTR